MMKNKLSPLIAASRSLRASANKPHQAPLSPSKPRRAPPSKPFQVPLSPSKPHQVPLASSKPHRVPPLRSKPPKQSEKKVDAPSYKGHFHRWLTSFGLIHRDLVSHHCHEAHIIHGYRPTPSSVCYCFKSLLLPTNETLNIWTHGIPCFLFLFHIIGFAGENFSDWSDPILYPYWLFVTGIILTLLGSTCAHIFNCLSVGAREVCFCCDYSTIAIHAIGLTTAFTFYVCPYSCLHPRLTLLMYLLCMVGNIGCVISACFTRYPNVKNKESLRVLPYVLMYVLLIVPCIHRYFFAFETYDVHPKTPFVCLLPVTPMKQSLFMHTCIAFLLGAIVHAYKVPERFYPGIFDIVGHSHQIFHLVTTLGLYYESRLVERNLLQILFLIKAGKLKPDDLHMNDVYSLFVPIIASVLACMAAVRCAWSLYWMKSSSVKVKT